MLSSSFTDLEIMEKNEGQYRAHQVRMQLVEAGGQTAQELGLNRIQGQTLVYLYLCNGECSLDQIEQSLGLSKAAVSIAARQLEALGLLRRVWKTGDRKRYYRTADNLGQALRDGLLDMLRRKVDQTARILDETVQVLRCDAGADDADLGFLNSRIERSQVLCTRARQVLNSRLLRYLTR